MFLFDIKMEEMMPISKKRNAISPTSGQTKADVRWRQEWQRISQTMKACGTEQTLIAKGGISIGYPRNVESSQRYIR